MYRTKWLVLIMLTNMLCHLLVCLSVPVYSFVFFFFFTHLSACPSVRRSVHLSISLSIIGWSVRLSGNPSFCLCIMPFIMCPMSTFHFCAAEFTRIHSKCKLGNTPPQAFSEEDMKEISETFGYNNQRQVKIGPSCGCTSKQTSCAYVHMCTQIKHFVHERIDNGMTLCQKTYNIRRRTVESKGTYSCSSEF